MDIIPPASAGGHGLELMEEAGCLAEVPPKIVGEASPKPKVQRVKIRGAPRFPTKDPMQAQNESKRRRKQNRHRS